MCVFVLSQLVEIREDQTSSLDIETVVDRFVLTEHNCFRIFTPLFAVEWA